MSTIKSFVLSPLAGALLIALGLPGNAALAADALTPITAVAALAPAKDLDRIEVRGKRVGYVEPVSTTATKTDTALRDVPQAVTVVTQELIDDQAMQNLADVVRYVPGVSMAQGEGNRDTPVFRGNSSTADMFIDGMRDDTQYFRDLYNIDRVEVLKGPNAMIFGRGGSGGVLNRVSKVADGNRVTELTVQAGSWDKRRIAGDVGRAINERAAFRVTGMVEDSDSYRDGYEAQRWGVNPTLALQPGDATTVTLGYEHFEDERIADRGIPSMRAPFNGRRLPVQTDASTFFGDPARSPTWVDIDALSALVEHDFGNGVTMRNRTRAADYAKFYQNVYAGDAAAVDASGELAVAIKAYSNATDRQNVFNQTDLTYAAQTGSVRHRLLAGAEFGRQVTDNFRQTGFFGAPGSAATSVTVPLAMPRYEGPLQFRQSGSDADNHGVARTAAVYLQDQITFTPQWQAILGLRYDRFDVDFRNNRTGETLAISDGLLSPRVGLVYKPAEAVSLYASYSIAHQPRAGEQLSSLKPDNAAFEPEKFKSHEIGAKWDLRPDLAFTAAAYRLERSNVIAPDPDDAARSILIDGQRVKGVELSLAGAITDAWSVIGGYAWQDGEIPGSTAELAQLPEQTASLWNRYDFSPTWAVGLGAIHRGELFASSSNEVVLKSYTRFDAAVFLTVNRNVELQLNVENLFDKQYYASAHNDNNITPGAPRAAFLSVTLNF